MGEGNENFLVKFTSSGKFLLQIGRRGKSKGSQDTADGRQESAHGVHQQGGSAARKGARLLVEIAGQILEPRVARHGRHHLAGSQLARQLECRRQVHAC